MRLITWNVNRRVSLLSAQAAALATRSPEVVALQEVTPRSWPLWRDALASADMPHAICSLDTAEPTRAPATRRRTGVAIATREPLEAADPLAVPWPETTLAARVDDITVHTAHVPNAANGWTKPHTLAALRAGLAATSGPRFNTPRRESPDGSVISFARDSRGRLRPERGEPWDAAELGIVPGLRGLGFADAFRTVHGYADRSPSWVWSHGGGWRLDHIFASDLTIEAAVYHHAWRDGGLSDHSPLEADLAAPSPA